MGKENNKFYTKWWFWVIIGVVLFGVIGLFSNNSFTGNVVNEEDSSPDEINEYYDLELTNNELSEMFGSLSELQIEKKLDELKSKRIKTTVYASSIDKASLSTKYLVKEEYVYPYSYYSYIKAFFLSDEKDKLLGANIGDIIVFSGVVVDYDYREYSGIETFEFDDCRVIEIKRGD